MEHLFEDKDIMNFTLLSDEDYKTHKFPDSKSKTKASSITLPLAHANLLIYFKRFIIAKAKRNNNQPLTDDEWMEVEQSEFNSFRLVPDAFELPSPQSQVTQQDASQTTTQYLLTKKEQMISDFRKGMKRELQPYPKLTDEKNWDNFRRSVTVIARAQGVENFLDPNYRPMSRDDAILWNEVQKYGYSVLHHILLTDKGKTIVRQHEHDYDAQAVWTKFTHHMTQSVKAQIQRTSLLQYITNSRLDTRWNGTAEQYILHWQQQVRALHELTPNPDDHLSDPILMVMLQNAVHQVHDLRQVRTNLDFNRAKTGQDITYVAYSTLLLEAAVAYDSSRQANSKSRLVNMHEAFLASDYYCDFLASCNANTTPGSHSKDSLMSYSDSAGPN
jgi:hypothetical protein